MEESLDVWKKEKLGRQRMTTTAQGWEGAGQNLAYTCKLR